MSAVDEVAGLPGGQELAALAQKVESAQPEAVREMAGRWKDAAGKCGDSGNVVQQSVNRLDGAWEGASADGFVAYMGEFGKSGASLKDALSGAAEDLETVAGALETAKTSVTRICEDLLSAVRGARAKNASLSPEDVEGIVRSLCADAAGDAKPVIETAENAVSAGVSALKGRVSGIAPKFSSLADPMVQTFVPAPANPVEWAPVREAETSTSSAEPVSAPVSDAPPAAAAQSSGGGASGGGGGGGSVGGGGGGGGGFGGFGASGPPPSSGPPPGNVDQWIREAIKILQANGIPVTDANIDEIWTIIEKESGGNPHAINDWDSNAAAGTPSKGLMQCIDPTFQSYKLPGHDDIYNPVDNIIAGVRYTFSRYGGFEGHPGLASMASGGGYQGY
ncbi:transglycosylase SLT domain-containing protein [Umezawaea sp. NPDC059074]|uniref:transglycosylase SLT domain-containing protein n=1 Tax=Umezawaea sp. NPDC059074 TaxID=3346716 RepID=UPI0036B982C3